MIASGNPSFRKKLWLAACLGVEPGRVRIALAKSICHLRGFIIAEG
jgi:hypothetical protein